MITTERLKTEIELSLETLGMAVKNHMTRPCGLLLPMDIEGMKRPMQEEATFQAVSRFAFMRAMVATDLPNAQELQLLFLAGFRYETDVSVTDLVTKMGKLNANYSETGFDPLTAEQCEIVRETLEQKISKYVSMGTGNNKMALSVCWALGRRVSKAVKDSDVLERLFAEGWQDDGPHEL